MPNPPYALLPEPGRYHIASLATSGNVIEVPNYNQDRAACSGWNKGENQQWFVQRSGRGYKIKNRKYGVYLAAPKSQVGTIIETSKYPTVWTLIRTHCGFAIQYGDENRVVELFHGLKDNGNVMLLWPSEECPDSKRWRFERMSDDTGGEEADTIEDEIDRLKRELAEKDAQLVLLREELKSQNEKLAARGDLSAQGKDIHDMRKAMDELHRRMDRFEQLDQC